MKQQQQHTSERHVPDPDKKIAAHERENESTKQADKTSGKPLSKLRSNRTEHDGSNYVL